MPDHTESLRNETSAGVRCVATATNKLAYYTLQRGMFKGLKSLDEVKPEECRAEAFVCYFCGETISYRDFRICPHTVEVGYELDDGSASEDFLEFIKSEKGYPFKRGKKEVCGNISCEDCLPKGMRSIYQQKLCFCMDEGRHRVQRYEYVR